MRLPLVIGGIPIIPIDFSEPPLMIVMRAFSLLGTIPLICLASLALGLIFFFWRERREIILLGMTVGAGELISLLLKWLFVEPRPRWPDPLVVLTSAGFPSGHAMRSVLFFGLLSYFFVRRIGSWRGRVGMLLAATGLVVMIGVSRIYLEAHSLSDVLAGYTAGIVWLGCVIIGITKIERTRKNRVATSVGEKCPTSMPARSRSRALESEPS